MNEITVRTQAEWDAVPKDFDGYIYIKSESGRIIIAERKGCSVVARGNSSVEARENSSVEATGNTQVVQYSDYTAIKVSGNARIVRLPKTIEEFCDFHGVETRDGKAILYKAVRPDGKAFYDGNFLYTIGEIATDKCDTSVERNCSTGLHIAHKHWALEFGRDKGEFKLLECAVPLDKIVLPKHTDGKVRTSELTVLREVPLEECGVYGKIIAKERARGDK